MANQQSRFFFSSAFIGRERYRNSTSFQSLQYHRIHRYGWLQKEII